MHQKLALASRQAAYIYGNDFPRLGTVTADDDGFRRCRHRCHITHARARSPPTVRIIADATAAYQRKRKRNAM